MGNSWMDDDDVSGSFLSCKEGEELRVKVKEMRKIVGDIYSKYNYKKKDGSPILTTEGQKPFHHELEATNGKVLTVGAISLMSALKKAKVDAGMEILIKHPGRGKYEIEILSGGPEPVDDAITMDDLEKPGAPF